MLTFYAAFARRLRPLRPALVALAAVAAVAFFAVVLLPPGARDEGWMLLAVTVFLWTISLLLVTHAFIDPPPSIERGDTLIRRIAKRLKLGLRWLLALTVTALFLLVVAATLRAASIVGRVLEG